MTNEAGANPIEAMQGGEYAETLASAMAGIADMFDLIMEDAKTASGHPNVALGFGLFKNDMQPIFQEVQDHGLQLAENIQAGAGETALNDLESAEEYDTPWEFHRDINSD
ncbi:hypothetical protein [Nocardiopsis sp. ATB16-24]|uniref:hypothetical protein n=1 Tax=Nocardiopsis sp. ATB16-24 TaxID=3019555 RepID=UPI002554BAE9|nr:hypothetical protein [Nocardiopsis sp. ATB16-24]